MSSTKFTSRLYHRDIDFDLENDRSRCLHDLASHYIFLPQDIRRITELSEKPVFYSGGLRVAEVVAGDLMSNDHFVSALSSITSIPALVEELCVAVSLSYASAQRKSLIFLQRDEEIGVYGFIFYRDCRWVPVVVDE